MGPPCTSHIAQILQKSAMCCTSHDNRKIAIFFGPPRARRVGGDRAACGPLKIVISLSCKSKIQMAAGSSSDQPLLVSSESSAYPDFKAYHRLAPDDRLPSKKNHIEQNFFILKRTKRNNRTEHIECQCAFCSISFKSFNSTQMRVHLTGENCIANRNSVGGSKFSKTEGLVRDRHSF